MTVTSLISEQPLQNAGVAAGANQEDHEVGRGRQGRFSRTATRVHWIDSCYNNSLELNNAPFVLQMISAEAPVLFAKACEIFIAELSIRAWHYTEENKRRTLQVSFPSSEI